MSNENKVVLPEPVAVIKRGKLSWHIPCDTYSVPIALSSGNHKLFTEQQVRALLATATGLPAQGVDAIDPVQAAADAASVGHLLNLVDHQTALLERAMAAMKAVEHTATPIDAPHGDLDARIPYEAWATFVDARAALLHDVAQSPVAAPQAQADARDAVQEVLMEHSGCGSNTQVDMLTVRLNPGDKVVMHKSRITQGFDRANRAAQAAAKGE